MEDVQNENIEITDLDEIENEVSGGDRNVGSDGGGGGDANRSSMSRPVRGVRDCRMPPFLMETFKMVHDPKTDSIISWSPTGTSFIILDPHTFAKDLLPERFRHNNLSSFIYQLNSYGFKKVKWGLHEYAHKYFQAGKVHLLKNIKSRRQTADNPRLKSMKVEMDARLDKLSSDQDVLKTRIQKLEQNQNNMANHLALIGASMSKQQKLVLLMGNAVRALRQRGVYTGETSRGQKFVAPQETTNLTMEPMDINGESINEDQSELQIDVESTLLALNSEDFMLLGKLMQDGQ